MGKKRSTVPDRAQDPAGPPTRVLDIAEGHRLPTPVEHSVASDAAYHAGLQDAPHYDREAVNPNEPLRFDDECSQGLAALLEARIIELFHQLQVGFDIVKDRRADEARASAGAVVARDLARSACETAQRRLDAVRTELDDIDATSLPRPRGQQGPSRDLSFWALLAGFGLAEGVVNYIAMLYLRDAEWITVALAVSVSAGMLGACFYLAKLKSRRPSLGAVGATIALVLVMLGTGALRFDYSRRTIEDGLAKHAETGSGPATLSTFMVVMLLAFSYGLPLLFGAITYLKVKGSTFDTVVRVRELREAALRADDELVSAEQALVAATEGRMNAEAAIAELVRQTETIIRHDAAAREGIRSAYYRGLAHGLADPILTARLDRRFANSVEASAAVIDKALEEAIGRLHEMSAHAIVRISPATGSD